MRALLFLALSLTLFAQRSATYNLGTLSAVGTTIAVNIGPVAHKHTVQVVTTGGPATCSLQLEGTLDDVTANSPDWANLSGTQVCTASITFHVVDRAVTGIRVNLTALSGGSSPTVSIKYIGIQ